MVTTNKPLHYITWKHYATFHGSSVKGYYIACGVSVLNEATKDVYSVTCGRCKATRVFKSDNYI